MGIFADGEVRVTMENGASKGVKPQVFHQVPGYPLLEIRNSGALPELHKLTDGELFDTTAEGLVLFWAGDERDALIRGAAAAIVLLNRYLDQGQYSGETVPEESLASIRSTGFGTIPVPALGEIATHYGRGGTKYSPFNWTEGYHWSYAYDAAMRHLFSIAHNELRDEDTGSVHLCGVIWHCFLLIEFSTTHPEMDDRPLRGVDKVRNEADSK